MRQVQIWLVCVCVAGGLNTGKMDPVYRLYRRRVLHRENSDCPSFSYPEATELSLSLYVSGVSPLSLSLHQGLG